MFRIIIILAFAIMPRFSFAQSNLDTYLRGGELLINGLSFFIKDKSEKKETNSKIITSLCIKNKMEQKISVRLTGKDEDGSDVKKEMVVQHDGKECVFQIPKGIYTYEIILANNETFKKGEYKFEDETTIVVKK